jgi:hypothetical protein
MEALPAVISTDGISLVVTNMIISGDEDADSFRLYDMSVGCPAFHP